MATTSNLYTANGSTVDFAFTFPYQNSTDIKVSVDEVVQSLTTHYTLHNATTIRFGSAPGSGKAVKIYRDTDSSKLAATFYPGSAIRSSDLNDNFNQNLYVTQEAENDASDALSNSRVLESGAYVSAITKATTAITTANTASTNASNAVTTANSATATANTASTNASNAVSTANTASTNATNAVNTANSASSTATTANTTANAADTKADSATATANTASTNASNAVSTANTASTNATNAVSTANTASTNATNAVNTANAASAAVAAAVLYTPKTDKTALQATEPTEDGYYEVQNSTDLVNGNWTTNSVTYTLSGLPTGWQGSPGLTVRLSYTHSSKTYAYSSYFANDPEDRYIAYARPFQSQQIVFTVKLATKTTAHRYNGTGFGNGFTIDGQQAPFLQLVPGQLYHFDQSDSTNSGHPLRLYEDPAKEVAYTTGMTTNGTPGSSGAYTAFTPGESTPTILYYMSSAAAHMGNAIQCNTAYDKTAHQVIDAGNFDTSSSTAALSNTYDGGNFDS